MAEDTRIVICAEYVSVLSVVRCMTPTVRDASTATPHSMLPLLQSLPVSRADSTSMQNWGDADVQESTPPNHSLCCSTHQYLQLAQVLGCCLFTLSVCYVPTSAEETLTSRVLVAVEHAKVGQPQG